MKKVLSLLLVLALLITLVPVKKAEAATIKLNKSKIELRAGDSYNLKLPGASGPTKWTSSKKSVATVSSSGKVKAIKEGTATIKATYKKKDYKCKVTVLSNKTVDIIFSIYNFDGSSIEEYAEKYKVDNPDSLDVKVYDDKHISVTIYETDRQESIKKIKETLNEYTQSLISDDNFKDIFTDAKADELFQNIKLYADKEAYEKSPFASIMASFAFGVVSDMVQAINLIDPDDRKCNLTIIDKDTAKILYPEN